MRALTDLGARTVCIKLGAAGAIGARERHVVRAPAVTGRVVDPTGCGDAFCGGFLVGLAESADLPTAMAYGSAAASFAAEDHGAAHALEPDRNEAQRRLHS